MGHRFENRAEVDFASKEPSNSDGFLICPLAIFQAISPEMLAWQAAIYHLAWERTVASERAPQPARDLFAIMN